MLNALISVPKPTSFDNLISLPEKPTAKQVKEHDAWHSVGCEKAFVGETASRKLYALISRASDEVELIAALDGCGINYTIEHSQEAQKGLVVDSNGDPVLDADDNRQYEIKVKKQGSKSGVKKYMADIIENEVPRRPTTAEVVVGGYGGHAKWEL